MLGNLFNVTGVTERLSKTAANELINICTIFLGVSVGATASAETFLTKETLSIVFLGLVAFCFSTIGGILSGKLLYLITRGKINPLIGSAGVSAVQWLPAYRRSLARRKIRATSCSCTPWART